MPQWAHAGRDSHECAVIRGGRCIVSGHWAYGRSFQRKILTPKQGGLKDERTHTPHIHCAKGIKARNKLSRSQGPGATGSTSLERLKSLVFPALPAERTVSERCDLSVIR